MSPKVDVIQEVNISELRAWERNPRSISTERLAALGKSMREDRSMLMARPLIALRDGRVIAGNQRLLAAEGLGWETIPVVYVDDLSESDAATWAMRDNNAYGEWDDAALTTLLAELGEGNVDLELTGFDDDELNRLLAGQDEPELPEDRGTDLALADVSIGGPSTTVTSGDVWDVGNHILVIASIYDGWPDWSPLLEPGMLLVPYPTPTLPLTQRAVDTRLLMIQPDVWLAGHLLDKFTAVRGRETVTKR